ncbi:MAG: threonine synthase [Acidobacteria bacterium RIFCSPLOWO2_12_FULL_54_10]|nr:MAG: threonine synthase [Acidobacteria bacterium RIFCSPLOWO2_12_FULL_54_10]
MVTLRCIDHQCNTSFPASSSMTHCHCGNLLDVHYDWPDLNPRELKETWTSRRTSMLPEDQSGVWRYRELIPYLSPEAKIITLREGNTPLLKAPRAAAYAGLDEIQFKHQGFNPTGSFKDNGMTTGVSQAAALGKKVVACVSTGNTSASMGAYAACGDLKAVIFIPAGQIATGKLSQALDYGALTIQVDANFDVTWKLVSGLVEEAGIYLLNSVNPYRIEGQKTIAVELLDQMRWEIPDWIVLPGGNLGNSSAFGKGLRELHQLGFITRLPRLAIIQAEGSAPLSQLLERARTEKKSPYELGLLPVLNPQTLATAIKIGAPASWKKALRELEATQGVCISVSEQEIADAKAVIGQSGIGCEPASAATLAGIRRLVAEKQIRKSDNVVAVLTGNLLKDPAYTLAYHQGTLSFSKENQQIPIQSNFGNQPNSVPPDLEQIKKLLSQ